LDPVSQSPRLVVKKFKSHLILIVLAKAVVNQSTLTSESLFGCNIYVSSSFLKVGITSWGHSCNTPGIPGVYASVAHGLCFIDWVTKCFEGSKYKSFYDYEEACGDWIDLESERMFDKLNNLNEELGIKDLSEERKSQIKFEKTLIDKYNLNREALRPQCIN
jgi:hypothetical protein